MVVKDNLLVIRMDVAGSTQWGTSWGRERVCGRGGIRKNCGNLWKRENPEAEAATTHRVTALRVLQRPKREHRRWGEGGGRGFGFRGDEFGRCRKRTACA